MQILRLSLVILLTTSCLAKNKNAERSSESYSVREKALYALGNEYAQNLIDFNPSNEELEAFLQGIQHNLNGQTQLSEKQLEEALTIFDQQNTLAAKRREDPIYKEGIDYIAKLKKDSRFIFDDSGIVYRTLSKGSKPKPETFKYAWIRFKGKKVNGDIFDSTNNDSIVVPVATAIACWKFAISKMQLGQIIELVCPDNLAFRSKGLSTSKVLPYETVLFEFELVNVANTK